MKATKTNMKATKFLSLMLALLLLVSALTACAKKTDDGVPVPSGMQAIASEGEDYYLMVPDHWLTDTTTGMTSAYVEDVARSSVSVCANELTRDVTSIEGYWDMFSSQFSETFADFTMLGEEPMDVKVGADTEAGATEGKKYRYTATVAGVKYRWMQVLFIRGTVLYIFTYTSTADGYEANLEDVDKILAHFTFR